MDMLWEKFHWILPLYMKPISFQSKASFVCSVTAAVFIDFCLKKLNVFSQHIGKKNKCISEFHGTNPQELKCWSTFYVNYFLRYHLMMQHQPILKRVNGTHEWAHRPYQPLSAPYHCCLYKHRALDGRQPPQTSWPVPICTYTWCCGAAYPLDYQRLMNIYAPPVVLGTWSNWNCWQNMPPDKSLVISVSYA